MTSRRFTKALLAVSLASAAAVVPATAHAATPKEICHEALKGVGAVHGVCFWSGQDFTGTLTAHPNPQSGHACANIDPAQSMVNLTTVARKVYALKGCVESNELSEVVANGSSGDLDPESTDPAESWR